MSLFTLILKTKGFPIAEAKTELRRIQQMGRDEFLDWQQKKAWEIARFHYEFNDVYREKVGKHFPERWDDLPVITKQDLQKPVADVLTKGIKNGDYYVNSTSGSSGTPFFFAKDKFSHAMTWAVITDRYSWYNIDFSSKQARFYGIPKELKTYWKERLKDACMNRQRFSVFDLSDERLETFLTEFKKKKFDYLYGYTNALVLFARYLNKRAIRLKDVCPALKLCITTSEVSTVEDHALLEKAFGVKHVREYGASETCLMGFDAPDNKWRLTEETLYHEIIDDHGLVLPAGNEGNVLATSLYNRAYPMVRYQIGDMAVLNKNDGSIYRSIQSLMGRTNDTVKLPGGKKAAGLTFYYISRSILESTEVLKEFIIRQTDIDSFVFDIVADRDLMQHEIQEINHKMDMYLQPGLKLTINRVPFIQRPASGKLKHFYSELK
jgi:phenylacetate-CoA ligase